MYMQGDICYQFGYRIEPIKLISLRHMFTYSTMNVHQRGAAHTNTVECTT